MNVRTHESLGELWTVQDRLAVGVHTWAPSERQLSRFAAERSALRQALSQRQTTGKDKPVRQSAWRRARSAVTKTA